MLKRLDSLNALQCEHCEEEDAIPRFTDPELRMIWVERMEAEHKPCEQYAGNTSLAKAARKVRCELHKIQNPKRRRIRAGVSA